MIITEEHIKLAEQAGACSRQLEEARKCIGEDLDNSFWACWYAYNVLKGRWGEAEEIIGKEAGCSYWYAREVIKGIFVKGEDAISKNPYWLNKYREFLNDYN